MRGVSKRERRLADGSFVATTIFLSALPLVMVGTGAWWVARRLREDKLAPFDPSIQPGSIDDDVRRLMADPTEEVTQR